MQNTPTETPNHLLEVFTAFLKLAAAIQVEYHLAGFGRGGVGSVVNVVFSLA